MSAAAPVHAAVLAAGLSSRFGGVQKALHRLGDQTLLERSLQLLTTLGVSSTTVVVGHGRADVEETARAFQTGGDVHLLANDRYADWNNFYSVELACEVLPAGDVLIVNGDIIYSIDALSGVLQASGADLYLAIAEDAVDEEAMKAAVEGERVTGLGKAIPASAAAGEFIGISRLTPAARRVYLDLARSGRNQGLTSRYYEDIYSELCGALVAGRCAVDADDWAEIDEPADLGPAQAVAARIYSLASRRASRQDAPPL